ncbi:MAG TPA: host-nuclease inhibitor Gam family protein, partial [Tepidisphaeraceae bacterium]|nr:host-nuclease inhibitor Gam family protein [Tepidisphaeraceae bacterium]
KTVPKHFAIEDEKTANWLIRKITSARAYAEHVKQWAEHELRRAEREEQTLLFLFGRQIETWAKSEIAKLHNRKSVQLPAGVIGFRSVGPSLQVDDEQIVLAWATVHCPSAVVSVPKLSRAELKSHFERTGEAPDGGARVQPAAERFFIK